jgi:hypothetical protein
MENTNNNMSEADILELLNKVKILKKQKRKEDPKGYHAEYVKKWRNANKEALKSNPDYILEKERIEKERQERREKVLEKLRIRKEKREARQKLKEERLAHYKKLSEEIKELIEESYTLSNFPEELKTSIHSIYRKSFSNGNKTHYRLIVNFFNKEKKFTTIKKATNPEFNNLLAPEIQAKDNLVSLLNEVKDILTVEEIVEKDEFDYEEDSFEDFDMGDF